MGQLIVMPKLGLTMTEGKITKFLALMEQFGITALTRTGKVALPRNT